MVKRIPTQVGDVLILRTDQSFTIHVIGTVSKDGHQDFENQRMALQYQNDYAAAVANVTSEPNRGEISTAGLSFSS